MQMDVNYVAVLAAGVLAMVIGYLWYSPMLFGNSWMKLVGLTKEKIESQKNQMPKTYSLMFVSALVMAYVLSYFIAFAGGTDIVTGAIGGFWAWLGFVATSMLSGALFTNKPMKLYVIDAGYYLVLLVVMGSLLASWR